MTVKPELLSPAGSFSAALYAFKNGADSVYLGMKDFSARKAAHNFTFDELRRLKTYASATGKKIYAALNTIIKEEEFPDLYCILQKLSIVEIDGVIVQDAGVLALLQRDFPELEIHASTQMAGHTDEGISVLKGEGVRRVILARELSLKEIQALKQNHPDIELEVFIHGALCFSFSGLCLASGTLLGRSANRGECAQVCRTWFKGNSGSGYYFSMKDLAAFRHIKKLQETGVATLKIEGRMKTPEYTGATVKLYRELIDGTIDPGQWEKYSKESRTLFSRTQNDYWLAGKPRSLVVDSSYASHRGIKTGTVLKTEKNSFTIKTTAELSVRDGLLFFLKSIPPDPVNFGIKRMFDMNGKKITSSSSGTTVQIFTSRLPEPGSILYKTSSHDFHWPELKSASYPPWKRSLSINITLTGSDITVSSDTPAGTAEITETVTVEQSRGEIDFRALLGKVFAASGDSWFTAGTVSLENKTVFADNRIFIPPAQLKKVRKIFYEKAGGMMEEVCRPFISAGETDIPVIKGIPRSALVPKNHAPIPFVLFHNGLSLSDLTEINDKWYLPLMPVTFESGNYFKHLREFVENHPGGKFVLGLNNIGHLKWVEAFSDNPRISFFIDYGLYIANREAYLFFVHRVPRLEFLYFWIEGNRKDYNILLKSIQAAGDPLLPLYFIKEDFSPHLFVSRACHTNILNGGVCPPNCGKSFSYSISQPGKHFEVKVEDCITWLFDRF